VLERQFHSYYQKATRKKGVTGENLLQLLERRLDNLVYRAGFGASRPQARQMINHGHILVNDRRVNISSFLVKPGNRIGVHESLRSQVAEALGARGKGAPLAWLSVDREKLTCTLLEIPKREAIPTPIQEQQIVELYSK
jgi:small subunit ribosomal protein S4